MAVSHSKSHGAAFVSTLTRTQRNALRVILAHESGPADMRCALGTYLVKPIAEVTRRTGLARAGRTSELFPQHSTAANIRIG